MKESVRIFRFTFSAETANEVYHHQVNLIKHDHACFCNCEHRRTEPEREDAK